MHRQSGRRGRHWFQHNRTRAVPSIRRCLLCLHNDTSDTDSDSLPLSSLLEDADNDTDAVNYSASLLTQVDSEVGNVNPAVCTDLMQVWHCHSPSVATFMTYWSYQLSYVICKMSCIKTLAKSVMYW